MEDEIQVDLAIKKTEAEWVAATDRFWLAFTPKLFEWLGWAALLAGLVFVQTKKPSALLGFVIAICNVGLLFYYTAFFARFRWVGLPFIKSERAKYIASLVISALLAGSANLVAIYAIASLSAAQS